MIHENDDEWKKDRDNIEDEIDEFSELDSDDEDIIEEEEKPLTRSRLFALVGIGFFLFLIFLVLLFPLDALIKSYLIGFSKKSGIIIEFKDLHFPVFGAKRIDSLAIQPSSNVLIKSEETVLDLKTTELISRRFDGELGLTSLKYESGEIGFLIKSILISGKLAGLDDRITKMTGDININIRGGNISSLPEIPIVGEVSDVAILQGQFKLKFRSGRLLIDVGNLNTSWLRIYLTGSIRLMDNFAFSGLDLEVCTTAQEKFATERPDLAGMLVLLPQKNGRACVPITGSIKSPKVEIPSMMPSQTPMDEQGQNLEGVDSPEPETNPNSTTETVNPNPVVQDQETGDKLE